MNQIDSALVIAAVLSGGIAFAAWIGEIVGQRKARRQMQLMRRVLCI